MSLHRTTTIFKPQADLDASTAPGSADPDACHTTTNRKMISEAALEIGQKGGTGYVTAKGWWTGVEAGQAIDMSHFILVPVSRFLFIIIVCDFKVLTSGPKSLML